MFVHGSGSSRHSPRNRYVASVLSDAGLATLLVDLLTPVEEMRPGQRLRHRAARGAAGRRLAWVRGQPELPRLPVGLFGASTGAAAALWAAADARRPVAAVVSRGGRPDLAGPRLADVRAPTLLIVGGADDVVLELNRAGPSAAALREPARRRPGRDPPVRGAGRPRGGGRAGPRLVPAPAESYGRAMTQPRLEVVEVAHPDDVGVIVGQAHFVKTVEDLHETLAAASPRLRFGIAFGEASGPRLVRRSGNDPELVTMAVEAAEAIGSGHVFVVLLRDGYPVNVLNAVKAVPEVAQVFAATANPLQVLVARTEQGGGVVGVVDGFSPLGVEDAADETARKDLLRTLGYKL